MMKVTLIPILEDNYAYLLEADNGEVGIVDPGEALPIIRALEEKDLKPDIIYVTHHHWDHTDGIKELVKWHKCPVAGPTFENHRIAGLEILLDKNSDISFGGEQIKVLETPGHTTGQINYYFPESKALFSGDTLFSMGCGRLFEGTAEQMWNSLKEILTLPGDTLIYCGHEYTVENGEFCQSIEPDNKAIQIRLEDSRKARAYLQPTIPVSLQKEKETNVFLRAETAERFAQLRKLKDHG